MPELPDVEIYRQYLVASALHQSIAKVHVASPSLLSGTTPQGLGRALKHRSFESAQRHGKNLFVALDNQKYLVMHFGMSGELKYFQQGKMAPDYTQILISFENGYQLAYVAPRKLGHIALADNPKNVLSRQGLGPDALCLSEKQFIERAAGRQCGVKAWLMDQGNMAGIGNIYSDEILFQAGIHPKQSVKQIDQISLRRLHKAMQEVLKQAIHSRANPDEMPDHFLLPHRHKGGHCPQCHSPLRSIKLAGRSSWYCPACQAQ